MRCGSLHSSSSFHANTQAPAFSLPPPAPRGHPDHDTPPGRLLNSTLESTPPQRVCYSVLCAVWVREKTNRPTMDHRPPQHAFPRPPPERMLIHNPNHQPQQNKQPQPAQSQPPYANYPAASQPQPPIHIPFTADPYLQSRRDPFLPPTAHHARRSSYGIHGGEGPPPGPGERHGGWGKTGTFCVFGLPEECR